MWTQMEFVTMRMIVLANWTLVVSAMAMVLQVIVVAMTSLPGTVIVTETNWTP